MPAIETDTIGIVFEHPVDLDCFIEVGPGKVLGGLLRQIDRSVRALNVEDPASLEKALALYLKALIAVAI